MITRVSFSIAVAGLLIAACVPSDRAGRVSAVPETAQLEAHAQCQAEQGLTTQVAVEVLELENGQVVASTLSGNGVSEAQAQAVNECARAKLTGGASRARSEVRGATDVADDDGLYGCKKGHGVFQGGTRICPGY